MAFVLAFVYCRIDNKPGDISQDNKISQVSIKQNLKEKCDEIERLKQIIDEQKVGSFNNLI